MPEIKEVHIEKNAVVILKESEVEYLKSLTQNKIHDGHESESEYQTRKEIFEMCKKLEEIYFNPPEIG